MSIRAGIIRSLSELQSGGTDAVEDARSTRRTRHGNRNDREPRWRGSNPSICERIGGDDNAVIDLDQSGDTRDVR